MLATRMEPRPLPVYRTFVVQMHVGAPDGRFSGRVEYLASGQSFEFATAEALLEFLADNIADVVPGRGSPG